MCCSKTYRCSQNCKSTVVLTVQTHKHETAFQKAYNSMNIEDHLEKNSSTIFRLFIKTRMPRNKPTDRFW